MKKLIAILFSMVLMSSAFADDIAKLNIKIADPIKENKYFICLYGVGCMSIRAGDNGKQFIMMPTDVGDQTKMVITDVTSMRIYEQPTVSSCDVNVKNNQRLTISGHLVVKDNIPHIDHLACSVS